MSNKSIRKHNKKRMAILVSRFEEIGVNVCPMELMAPFIPKHFSSEQINDWLTSVRNVWHGRNSDATIVDNFHEAYDKAKQTYDKNQEFINNLDVHDPKRV